MLVVAPLGRDAARYYAGTPGIWVGGGAAALGLEGAVDDRALGRLLTGRQPGGRGPLGDPRHPRRRAGWDLTFAAPKGVSLVAALDAGAGLDGAHRAAVDEALGLLTRHGCWAQRGGTERYRAAGGGLVAARFEHETSAAGDPHLHTHVIVVNAVLVDGRWSALASSPLWRTERELAAAYRLGLRHHVHRAGHHPRWVIRADGATDLADVPRQAVVAASRRRRQILERAGDGRRTPGAARVVTRGAQPPATAGAVPPAAPLDGGWRDRVAAAGLTETAAAALLTAGPRPGPAPQAGRVAEALATRASSFTIRDVMRALEVVTPAGLAATEAERCADQFCAGARPAGPGRWTTPMAMARDDSLVAGITARAEAGAAVVGDHDATVAAAEPALDPTGAATVRALLTAGRGVDVLGGAAGADRMDAQAAVLDTARRAWQAAGYRVAMVTATPAAARRWEALTALPDERALAAPAQVLVVDRADRLSPPDLEAAVARSTGDTKVVLVEGGTLPARHRPFSDGLVRAGVGVTRVQPGLVVPTPERHGPPVTGPGGVTVLRSGRDAVNHLLAVWDAGPAGQRPLLVGLGPAEAVMLNTEARARLRAGGVLQGEALVVRGREFVPGDRVVALRANPALGVPGAALGTVGPVREGGRAMTVVWDGREDPVTVARSDAGFVGHGWATTPALAASTGAPVLMLGTPPAAGPRPERIRGWAVVAPTMARTPEPEVALARAAALVGGPPAVVGDDRPLWALDDERRRLGAALGAAQTAARGGDGWIAEHGPGLRRWEALGRAGAERVDALVRSFGPSPGGQLVASPGPEPSPPGRRAGMEDRELRHLAAALERDPAPGVDRALTGRPISEQPLPGRSPPGRELDLGLGLG